jgi:hypothetical protein
MLILKSLLGGVFFLISYRIILNRIDILIQTLGDTGATRYTFIQQLFVQKFYCCFSLTICKDISPAKVQGYNANTTQDIDSIMVLSIVINGHYFSDMPFVIIPRLGHDDY